MSYQTAQQPIETAPVFTQPPTYTALPAQPDAKASSGGFKNTLIWFLVGFIFFPAWLVCAFRGFKQPDFFSRSLAVTSSIMGVILFLYFFAMVVPGAYYAMRNIMFILGCYD